MSKPRILAALAAVTLFLGAGAGGRGQQAWGAISASGDNSQPFTTTNHSITGPSGGGGGASVTITEDIILAPSAGPWHKNLINNTTGPTSPPGMLPSGANVGISETLTNLGGIAWNQWTERVVTRTTISSPNDAPGYQFNNSTLFVEANYGAGFVPLTNGVQYTVVGTPAPGPGFEPNGWEAITITLQPGFQINPTNKLRISKDIFEVFGDGNIWLSGEAAEIAQFPGAIPEPASLALMSIAALSLLRRRR
jgi:hypothetical protein